MVSAALKRAAKALWDAQRKQEIAALSTVEVDTDFVAKAARLMRGSDRRTQIIVGFSAVSKSLAIGLRTHLSHSTERDRKEMLEGLGPLASDAAKLRLSRLMGWMPPVVSSGAQALRQARNLVAHDIIDAAEIPFPGNLTGETKTHLDERVTRMIDAANSGEDVKEKLVATGEHEIGRYALLLSFETLDCVMWGPARLRLGMEVTTHAVFSSDEAPAWATQSQANLARGILLLSGAPLEMVDM